VGLDVHKAECNTQQLAFELQHAPGQNLTAVNASRLVAVAVHRCCVLFCPQLVKAASKAGSQEQQQLPVSVRAQLALLSQQWPVAEALLLAQGQVDETIALYQQAHRCVTRHQA
jgi:hypothetical protein